MTENYNYKDKCKKKKKDTYNNYSIKDIITFIEFIFPTIKIALNNNKIICTF